MRVLMLLVLVSSVVLFLVLLVGGFGRLVLRLRLRAAEQSENAKRHERDAPHGSPVSRGRAQSPRTRTAESEACGRRRTQRPSRMRPTACPVVLTQTRMRDIPFPLSRA